MAADIENEIAFTAQVTDALKFLREGTLLQLATSPLAYTPLVEACFLTGEPMTPDRRGRVLQSVLRWGVEKLRPDGPADWMKPTWRSYNILRYFYVEGMRASQLAERMAIAEQTLYQVRPQAINALSHILHQEQLHPTDLPGRKLQTIADRYARCNQDEQIFLRITALFNQAAPATLLYPLLQSLGVKQAAQTVQSLIASHLLIVDDLRTEMTVHPEARSYLLTHLAPNERVTVHQAASNHYLTQRDYLEAARHWRAAGDFEQAAKLLIDHQRDISDNLQVEELYLLASQFRPGQLSAQQWARLKILMGELAEFTRNLDSALAEYQQALSAPDLYTKALAFYRRAKVFEYKNIDESLAHYDYCVGLLEAKRGEGKIYQELAEKSERLLVQIYIDRASLFLQVRPDLQRAEADLKAAQRRIRLEDRSGACDLHNALGIFYLLRREPESSAQHYWQAWLAANEVGDLERMSKTAHNLGRVYLDDLQQYDQALEYLQKSHTLAQQTGNRQMEGLCLMSLSACYFWQGKLQQSIQASLTAAEIFTETGNQLLLTRVLYGLAEAYAELKEMTPAQRYFQQGLEMVQTLQDHATQQAFTSLAQQYPQLYAADKGGQKAEAQSAINQRQQQALHYIQTHGSITNREYQNLTGVAQKQAVRDLNDLVVQGLLDRVGQGRATHYIHALGNPILTHPPLPQQVVANQS